MTVAGQSTTIDYPTPLYSNTVNGTIRARDVGDGRLTSYFYTFLGNQGDMFMNVVTKNFNGDIDVFLADGLKPMTKVTIFAEAGESETGRVLYFRKPEKLILRIEGRSPNDESASFQIKFGGSFEASKDTTSPDSEVPTVDSVAQTRVKVNSVGTILEVAPKTRSTPKPVAESSENNEGKAEASNTNLPKTDEGSAVTVEPEKKTEVVVTDNTPEPVGKSSSARRSNPGNSRNSAGSRGRRTPVKKAVEPEPAETDAGTETAIIEPKAVPPRNNRNRPKAPPTESESDPLANIHLIIEFKDGSRVERPMSEVLRFTADRGILTVIGKDGTIGRYRLLDITRTTIE